VVIPNGNSGAAGEHGPDVRERSTAKGGGDARESAADHHHQDARHQRDGPLGWRGRISAAHRFDKATGKQVGAVNIPAVTTAVPMTFLYQGKQYIVYATAAERISP